jgi:hypothetical protein
MMKYLRLFEEHSTDEPNEIKLARLGLTKLRVLSWSIQDSTDGWQTEYDNHLKEIRYLLYPDWPTLHNDYEDLINHSDYEILPVGTELETVSQMVRNAANYYNADWIYNSTAKTWEKV